MHLIRPVLPGKDIRRKENWISISFMNIVTKIFTKV